VARSFSKSISFERITLQGEEGMFMVRLAIAVNGFISGLEFLRYANKATGIRARANKAYILNVQIGYLHEAILLVENQNPNAPSLMTFPGLVKCIERLSPKSQKDYNLIRECLHGGSDRHDFIRYVVNFRNQIAFHHDAGYVSPKGCRPPLVNVATQRLAQLHQSAIMHISPSNSKHYRFEFADGVMDMAVCRLIWEIDPTIKDRAGIQAEADRIATWIQMRSEAFVGFASELCAKYFIDKSSV